MASVPPPPWMGQQRPQAPGTFPRPVVAPRPVFGGGFTSSPFGGNMGPMQPNPFGMGIVGVRPPVQATKPPPPVNPMLLKPLRSGGDEREDGELSDFGEPEPEFVIQEYDHSADQWAGPQHGRGGGGQGPIKCRQRGCNFEGAPGAVRDHYRTAHVRDIVQKQHKRYAQDNIAVPRLPALDTPEEIARWREERRKNWPSAANQRRKAEEKKKSKSAKKKARAEKEGKKRPREEAAATPGDSKEGDTKEGEAVEGGDSKRAKIEDGDIIGVEGAGGGLAALADYGSGTESSAGDTGGDTESESDSKDTSKAPNRFAKTPRGACRVFWRSGKCKFGKKCRYKHIKNKKAPANKGPQSLLKKLLASDICKEHAVLLQCLQFVLSTKFLSDIPQPTIPQTAASAEAITS